MPFHFFPQLQVATAFCAAMALSAGDALSEASGPDFYRVTDVAPDDTLNMRLGPSTEYPVIAELPHTADGVANLGCTGGLSLEEWTEASEEERRASKESRWCLVGYDRTVGWAAGRFLGEGASPDQFRAGAPISGLQGSEWRATWLADERLDHEVTVAFKSGGEVIGNAGCNMFKGTYTEERGLVEIGPLSTTRKACPADLMDAEDTFLRGLQNATSRKARHLVLVLLDAQSVIVAQFARTDWD